MEIIHLMEIIHIFYWWSYSKKESLVFFLFKIRKICAFFYVAVLEKKQSKISVFYKSGNFRVLKSGNLRQSRVSKAIKWQIQCFK